MNLNKLFIYLSTVLIFAGCSDTSSEISDEKFTDVLTDIHLADGVYEISKMQKQATETDNYDYIYIKNGISREQFVSKLNEEMKQPEDIQSIYKKVLSRIENLSKSLSPNSLSLKVNEINIWESKPVFFFPEDGEADPKIFNIIFDKPGTFTLRANAQIFKDDGSVNPKLTIVVVYTDGTKSSSSVAYSKNNIFTNYVVSVKSESGKQIENISGWLFDHSSLNGTKHGVISDIKLTYLKD